jgi:hypothetical protein
MLASARDSSEKPTARNERGLVADSPVPLRLAGQAAKEYLKLNRDLCQLLPTAFAYCLFFSQAL